VVQHAEDRLRDYVSKPLDLRGGDSVRFPREAGWLEEFTAECLRFPDAMRIRSTPYPGPGVGSPDVCRKCTDAMVLVKPATVVLRRPVRPHPGLWTALRVMGTARPQALWRSKFRHLVGVSVLRLVSNSSMRTGVAGFACERRNNTNTVACPGTL